MTRRLKVLALVVVLFAVAAPGFCGQTGGPMGFTVSMERPSMHYFHVVFRCEGLKGETLDFKLPVWSPGYYRIMDYAKNVINFRAEDGAGRALAWEKTAKNTWRVYVGRAAGAPGVRGAPSPAGGPANSGERLSRPGAASVPTGSVSGVIVRYDVYAFTPFVADSYLDDAKAFLVPTGVLMHVAGLLRHSVTLTVKPDPAWATIATGLDPVPGQPGAFTAPDFDVLYDCPILMGSQDVLPFDVRGVPHTFVGDNLGTLDKAKFVDDLKRIVESAATLIGEIPYRRYAFLAIGPGGGGLEHQNSAALSFTAAGLMTNPGGYKRWLEFVSHEFFHLYNVKRIRPIALGPFDYDRENYTTMLWVSEGFTSYYESLILRRAGLISREDVFEDMRSAIAHYENVPGRLVQSAAASSFDTWLDFFNRSENAANTTISYYDKGEALGMILDFAIRHGSKNARSLDDVMRALYKTYYKEKARGFTDAEFRAECERAAGGSLSEIFDEDVATTKDVDYAQYLGYAGLEIDAAPHDMPGTSLGASFGGAGGGFFGPPSQGQGQDGNAVIGSVERGGPAEKAGLSAQDEIVAVDGARVTGRSIGQVLEARKPGDRVRLLVSRHGKVREFEVELGKKTERTFRIKPAANPDPLQTAILKSWLGEH